MEANTFYFDWEPKLMIWLQSHLGNFWTTVLGSFSFFGEELVIVAVLVFLYWCYDKKTGRFVALNVLTSIITGSCLKNVFLRLRPYMVHDGIKCLKPVDKTAEVGDIVAQGYSFPSLHSGNSLSLFGSVAAFCRKKAMWIFTSAVALLVGFSRVIVGNHYPTDVFVGWLIAIVNISFLGWIQKKVKNKVYLYIPLCVILLSGFFFCRTSDYFSSMGLLIGFCVGDIVEGRFVRFENTRNVPNMILRFGVGVAAFLGLNILFKLPFSEEFLASGTLLSLTVRTVRYTVLIFIMTAVYPLSFRYFDKITEKKK